MPDSPKELIAKMDKLLNLLEENNSENNLKLKKELMEITTAINSQPLNTKNNSIPINDDLEEVHLDDNETINYIKFHPNLRKERADLQKLIQIFEEGSNAKDNKVSDFAKSTIQKLNSLGLESNRSEYVSQNSGKEVLKNGLSKIRDEMVNDITGKSSKELGSMGKLKLKFCTMCSYLMPTKFPKHKLLSDFTSKLGEYSDKTKEVKKLISTDWRIFSKNTTRDQIYKIGAKEFGKAFDLNTKPESNKERNSWKKRVSDKRSSNNEEISVEIF